jgi:hypothetical protein
MFRGFVAGVLATIVVALVGGYIVLRSGVIPTNADASLVGRKPGRLKASCALIRLETPQFERTDPAGLCRID